jgi:putative tryptophan/tyrosine transport system substrate-binding protein
MNRKFFWLFTAFLLFIPHRAAAQPPVKIPKIGVLRPGSPALKTAAEPLQSFRQGLRDLGYIEGQNISFEYRWARDKYERLPDLAAELTRLKVDVIFTASIATDAARDATKTIPIVFVNVGDPVANGLVGSLARPGGNITGITNISPDLSGKQLELLKESFPAMSRIAVLWNPTNAGAALQLKETESAALLMKLQLQLHEAQQPKDLDSAFSAISGQHPNALLVLADPMLFQHGSQIANLAARRRLPTICWQSSFVVAGGLMSYGTSSGEMNRRAAVYVAKILKGSKPAELPVEQPTKFELTINIKTAKQIGLIIPPNVLARADRVVR